MSITNTLSFAFLFLLVMACQRPSGDGQDISSEAQPQPVEPTEGLCLMDRSQIEVAGIRWGKVQSIEVPEGPLLFGEWVLHPEYTAQVHSIAAGRVVRIDYTLNQTVGKGSSLIEVESPELIDLQREYLEKSARATFLEQEWNRMKALEEGGATALKNLQSAESSIRDIRASLAGLKADLALYGIEASRVTPESLTGRYVIKAPLSGRIAHSSVAVGQWLEPGTPVCMVRDIRRIHADLFAFPAQQAALKVGSRLEVPSGSPAGVPISLEVVSLDRELDPEKKSVRIHTVVRGELPGHVVEGGYLSARLSGMEEPGGTILPAAAVRKDGGRMFVWKLDESGRTNDAVAFRKVMVEVMHDDGQRVAIRLGTVGPDDVIVLEGAYYVQAQSQVAEFGEEE